MKKLTVRQTGLLLFVAIISVKFVTYPALYAEYAGIDGYLGLFFNLLIDLMLIVIILFIAKKNPDKTFNQIISDFYGVAFTRVINFILFVNFLVKACYVIKTYDNYLLEVLFSHLPVLYYIIPLLLLLAFIMGKSLRALGRSVEIFIILIVVGLVFTLLIPSSNVEFINLLPILENGFGPVMSSGFYCSFSVGDFFILFMLLGNFKLEKKAYKKIFNYALFADILVMLFYIVFYAVFGVLAINESLAIADLPLFISFPSSVGRIDWITINLWTITLIFQSGFLLSCTLKCFNYTFNLKGKAVGIGCVLTMVYLLGYVIIPNLSSVIELTTHPIFASVIVSLQMIFPIIFLIAGGFKKEKNDKFAKKVFSK